MLIQTFGVSNYVDDGIDGVINFVDRNAVCLLLDALRNNELETELVFETNVKDVIDECVNKCCFALIGFPSNIIFLCSSLDSGPFRPTDFVG